MIFHLVLILPRMLSHQMHSVYTGFVHHLLRKMYSTPQPKHLRNVCLINKSTGANYSAMGSITTNDALTDINIGTYNTNSQSNEKISKTRKKKDLECLHKTVKDQLT